MSTDFSLPRAVHAAISASPTGQVSRLKLASDLNVSELVLRDSLEPHVTANIFTCRRGPATGRDAPGPILYGKGPWFAAAHFRAAGSESEPPPAPAPAAPPAADQPDASAPAPSRAAPSTPRKDRPKAAELAIDFDTLVPISGVPLPAAARGTYERTSKWAAALGKLGVGQHYIFPDGTESAVNKASQTYGRRTNKAFRIRKVMHNGQPAVGLWRVEDPKPGAKS